MENKKYIYLLTIISIIYSCQTENEPLGTYNMLSVNNSDGKNIGVNLEHFENNIENGTLLVTFNNSILIKGKFNSGYKVGKWNYNINDTTFSVNWDAESNSVFKFSKPNQMNLSKETSEKTKKFIVYSDSITKMKIVFGETFGEEFDRYKTLKDFSKASSNYIYKHFDVIEFNENVFLLNGQDTISYFYYSVNGNKSKKINVKSSFFKLNDSYCEFSMIFHGNHNGFNRAIYFEVFQSLRVRGSRVLSPFIDSEIITW